MALLSTRYAVQAFDFKSSECSSKKVITKDEINYKIDSGEHIQIVNVLDPEKYSLGMIRSSKRIPLAQLGERLGELDKSKFTIAYCASNECIASRQAAEKLKGRGFDARAYVGGIRDWKEAGLPMEV